MHLSLIDDQAEVRFAGPNLSSLPKQAGLGRSQIWLAETP